MLTSSLTSLVFLIIFSVNNKVSKNNLVYGLSFYNGFLCPNSCNQQGVCLRNHTCSCATGFTGPDCSLRVCKYGTSWSAKPYELDKAHSKLECAGNGLCNRKTGACQCFAGFEGHSCDRVFCPGNCNGHGKCVTLEDMYLFYNANNTILNYQSWDGNAMTGCVCELGYTGASCDVYECPKGNDPLIPFTGYQTINFTTYATWGAMTTSLFLFSYNGQSFELPGNAETFNSSHCEKLFNSLVNIRSVNCTRLAINYSGGGTYVVQFKSFPHIPKDNNIYQNDGILSKSNFSCNVVYNDETSQDLHCIIQDMSNSTSYPSYSICSNRGTCDISTGTCSCYEDFTNSNCDTFKYQPYEKSLTYIDILDVVSTCPNHYSKSIISIDNIEIADSSFNLIRVSDKNGVIFNMDAAGNIDMSRGSLTVSGSGNTIGMLISKGGLAISNGLTIYSKGLIVNSTNYNNTIFGEVNINAGSLNINNGLSINNGGLNIYGGVSIYGSLVQVTGGLTLIAGGLSIFRGGLFVTNGLTLNSGGLYINGKGITVNSQGLYISGGLTINGINSPTSTDSLTITSGGFYTSGSITVSNLGAVVSTLSILKSVNVVTGGITVFSGGLVSSNGLTVNSNGISANEGLTVNSNNVYVLAGGLYTSGSSTIGSNLIVTSGVTVVSGGLVVSNGASLSSGLSIASTGIVSLYNGGLYVTASGLTTNVLAVTNGLTLAGTGMFVTGGLTMTTGGMYVSGSLTTINGIATSDGLTIYGGSYTKPIIVSLGGFQVTGGLIISSGGFSVNSGGISVLSSGLISYGTFSIFTPGLSIDNGLTITNGGFVLNNVGSTMSIKGNSIIVTNGLSVNQNTLSPTYGLVITDGLTIGLGGGTITTMTVNADAYFSHPGYTFTGFSKVSGGMSIYSAGVMKIIQYGLTVYTGGLVVSGGLSCQLGGLNSPNGLTIQLGFAITGGITQTGNLNVFGGLTNDDTGMTIQNGLTISNVGFHTTNDLNVINGASISKGVTIPINGLQIVSGGITINNGLVVSGATTIASSGFQITGGLSIASKGICITGGLSILQSGMYIYQNGMTIPSGVIVSNGMTLSNGKMIVENYGMIVNSGGLLVSNGMTISSGMTAQSMSMTASTGLVVSTGLTVNNGLYLNGYMTSYGTASVNINGGATVNSMQVTNGLTIASGGLAHLSFDGGLSILTDGLNVQGGLTMYGHPYFNNGYSITSDKRLKVNIENITNSMNKINQLQGVSYNWINTIIDDLSFDNDEYYGLIAQDVQNIIPEVVTSIHQKYLGINYQEIIPLLIEGIHDIYNEYQSIENELLLLNIEISDKEIEQNRLINKIKQLINTIS